MVSFKGCHVLSLMYRFESCPRKDALPCPSQRGKKGDLSGFFECFVGNMLLQKVT